ncbi:NAD(P)-binding domain-containing protein [Gordonia desulfuricans]|uniref:NAD(P)-binding domain-containing protein n=1 Tax=Gordonia desulfuricans TaxID=89051 RepID=A0A7K3LVJ5_9ACTN|nr:NAD(P)-binding domain-containing protein [Gordonia desulfuricans]NDK92303.1 NAD(P)-binding domain-containing protein [Gordonia desulfuricans]
MKVCVVGAGPCGLTTIKQLLDEGHEVVCFDKNADIGGLWLRHNGDDEQMKAYDNLHLTISMKLMAYSDHPFSGDRVFYTRKQYFRYLAEYADRFGLRPAIRFGSQVTDVRRDSGGWAVTVRHDGVESQETFDAVAVCSGPFKTPNRAIPEIKGFTGEIVHSSEYRNNKRFQGKKVLIVGLAESGADIVREIGDVADTATLSIRSRAYLLPRVFNSTRTTDHGTIRSHHHEMLRRATDYPFAYESFWGRTTIAEVVFTVVSIIYGIATTALGALRVLTEKMVPGRRPAAPTVNPFGQPAHPPQLDIDTPHTDENWDFIRTWNRKSHPDGSWAQRSIFSKNVSFVPSITSGKVLLNDSGIADADGTTVRFQDGTAAEFDTIVLCTGFSTDEISIGELRVRDGNVRNLYKHFLHPDHQGTVAFIGFVRPFSGGIPICAEMQARYFAQVCSGTLRVPRNIDEVIDREKKWEEHWTALSPRHTESIPSNIVYLDSLAREIGCLVPMWRMILNPKLFIQLWFGPFNQAGYRIVGPHALGRSAVDDLYSELVDNRREMALRMSLLQLMPSHVHPEHMM